MARAVPVYAYEFDDPAAPFSLPVPPWGAPMHAYHTAEIAYVFGSPWILADPGDFSAEQSRLSALIQADWGAFARTGTPDAAGGPAWPRFRGETGAIARLAPAAVGPSTDFVERHRCGFWDSIGGS